MHTAVSVAVDNYYHHYHYCDTTRPIVLMVVMEPCTMNCFTTVVNYYRKLLVSLIKRCVMGLNRRMFFMMLTLALALLLLSASFIATEDVMTTRAVAPDPDIPWPGARVSAPCIDRMAHFYRRVEDIFCENLPAFQPQFKNPCMYIPRESMRPMLKCLPYFYIIGMDKSATTDLHSKIASHPDVRDNNGMLRKETAFWSWSRYGVVNYHYRPRKSYLTDYLQMFHKTGLEIQHKKNRSHIITGDATPMDLWDFRHWDLIPQNFNKSEPEILTPHLIRYIYKDRLPKFLIQLREPVERLYSDYIFLGQGQTPHTFHAHVHKAIAIVKDCLRTKSLRLCFFDKNIYRKLPTRIHLGCYSVYIQEWLAVFPRSSFHVTRTEDFQSDMMGTLEGVFSFLGLDPLRENVLGKIANQSRKHVTKSKTGTVLPQTFRLLYEFYLPCLKETAALLNDERFLWKDVYDRYEQTQRHLIHTHTRDTGNV